MRLKIDLKERSYEILLNEPRSISENILVTLGERSYILITNDTIAEIYKEEISKILRDLNADMFTIPDGEQYKTIETWNLILTFLLEKRFDRKCTVIAFGGGVIGDITGFAAASFLRGIDFVQVPTTLLAMVDSSVGGKTAVNHPMGKNMIGAFYQPKLVWIDTKYLQTLPDREFLAGCGEVFKYGFIGGKDVFNFISENAGAVLSNKDSVIEQAIEISIKVKADIVERDERESSVRALLNFGHTFGHSLEKFYGYGTILHGEGIVWGLKAAVELGKEYGTVPKEKFNAYDEYLSVLLFPELPFVPDIDKLYENMFSDKKVNAGKIKFVVPEDCGRALIKDDVDEDIVKKVLHRVFDK